MKLAILTITVGDFYDELAEVSHPTIQAYADKIGADFIRRQHSDSKIVGYEKLRLIRKFLGQYDRVLFLDTDILVRHDAPNIFDLVPPDRIGAFDEGALYPERRNAKAELCRQMGVEPDIPWVKELAYFNTGVLVVSREHEHFFEDAVNEFDNFGEQTLLNYRFFHQAKMFRLPHRFNRLIGTLRKSGEMLDDSFFMHFAGAFAENCPKEENLAAWHELAKRFGRYKEFGVPWMPKRIYIEVATALGDTVSTEPVVRYIREVLEPTADITISTCWPDVFEHLKGHPNTTILGEGETVPDLGHYKINLFPDRPVANYNLMPPIDYAALCAFQGQLPKKHRGIRLKTTAKISEHLKDLLLVHPGRSWQSKTFPREWWNAVIQGLVKFGAPVALIGRTYENDDFRGTVDVEARGTLDLRNRTTVPELIAVIADAVALVSNDSSPVHIAGAFKTPVVMISTAKQADFIWPERDPKLNITMGRPIKNAEAVLGIVQNVYMHECEPEELLAVLPDPAEVVKRTLEASTMRGKTCRSKSHPKSVSI